jgi:hypothetical protein
MENTADLKKGDLVLVDGLVHTQPRYKLDSTGHMRKMEGHAFPIREITGHTSIRIFSDEGDTTYIFDIKDIKKAVVKELEPKIFKFDTQHLDI